MSRKRTIMKKISQLLIGLAVLLAAAQAGVQITPAGGIGPQGPAGTNGAAATVAVTNAVTGAPGSAASVTNLGTSGAANLQFTIPAGSNGVNGVISNAVLLALSLGDGYGLSSNIASSAIVWPPPVAAFSIPALITTNVPAVFTNLSEQVLLGSITNSIWNFGDGNSLISTASIVSNTYATAGTKTVSLTVFNSWGSSNSVTTNLTVNLGTVALQFDGTQNYVDIPTSSLFAPPSAFTVECWVKNPSAGGWFIDKYDISGNFFGFGLQADGTGNAGGFCRNGNGYWEPFTTNSIADGNWHHVALCHDGTNGTFWVDGVLAASDTDNFGPPGDGGSDLYFGWTHWSAYNSCILGEVRISNIARYTTNFTPPCSLGSDTNTVGYWPLNDGSATNAVDASGNGNDGAFGGSPPPAWVSPGVCP